MTNSIDIQQAMAAVQANPKDVERWVALGRLLAQAHQLDRARDSYRYALQIDPAHVEAQAGMARLTPSPTDRPAQSVTPTDVPQVATRTRDMSEQPAKAAVPAPTAQNKAPAPKPASVEATAPPFTPTTSAKAAVLTKQALPDKKNKTARKDNSVEDTGATVSPKTTQGKTTPTKWGLLLGLGAVGLMGMLLATCGLIYLFRAPLLEIFSPATSLDPLASVGLPGVETVVPSEIFSSISPSIAFVDTEAGTGSGVLIAEGYLVTNAHVVWPYDQVRIVFPDGTEFVDAPVLGWDLIADLAVIGPLETSIDPVALVDGEASVIGSDVYLIGYPGEVESFPQPTISRGLISRLREWDRIGMTFFQTDASIAGGQSGGILVSEQGQVIGISGYRIGDGEFGIVASAADANTRIQGLIDGEDIDGLGPRRLLTQTGEPEQKFSLGNYWDTALYIINEPKATEIEIQVKGDGDIGFGVIDVWGEMITYADDRKVGSESATLTTEVASPYYLTFFMDDYEAADFEISSSHDLIPYKDNDDNETVSLDRSFTGHLDYPGDFDYFNIELDEGDKVEIRVESLLADAYVSATFWQDQNNEYVSDDDSGGGFFGLDARLIYQAAYSGQHLIIVEDATGVSTGGYFLQVSEAAADAVAAVSEFSPEPVDTPHGEMLPYELFPTPFTFLRPAGWALDPAEEPVCGLVTACYVDANGANLSISIDDLIKAGLGEMSPEAYLDLILAGFEEPEAEYELISQEKVEIQLGLFADRLEFASKDNQLKLDYFVYLHAGTTAINLSYLSYSDRYEALKPAIQYSLDSVELLDPTEGEEDLFYLEQGLTYLSFGETDRAIEAFTEALVFDPNQTEAYWRRAGVYRTLSEYDLAVADMDAAIKIEPDNAVLYKERGFINWHQADFEQALIDLDQALNLDEQYDHALNLRALVYTMQGEPEKALADVNAALDLRSVEAGNADLLDTRGFIYLKVGDFERAKADFETIFEQGYSFAYVELGAGIAYAALDETDKAIELLETGLASIEDVDQPEPQLAELIERATQALAELK